MKSIAIITARGGSKRIPLKNIKDFCGKPIIAYSIEAAKKSNIFDEVMVSTDSEEIAGIAQKYGASVPFMRSKKTSDDFATTSDVLEEVVMEYSKNGKEFDCICCIYPTAPFITQKKLNEAFAIFQQTSANCVLTVVNFSYPPQRAFVIRDNKVVFQYPEYEKTRSQDLEPIYHDCGQFYILRTSALLHYHSIVPPDSYPYFVPDTEVQDIDSFSDWEVAEAKYSVFISKM